MIRSLQKSLYGFARKVRIPTPEEVRENWNNFSPKYSTFDLGPQTFYYSFASIMELHKASNILEVACGNGKLLHFALDLKKNECGYLASDLAPSMVSQAQQNLKQHFEQY